MMYKHCLDAIGGFNERYKRHQDSELLIRFFELYKIGSILEPLVEIGENQAENELHGLKLEELKAELFSDFGLAIDRINLQSKNFKKKVLTKHYTQVIFDHLQNKYYYLGFRLFVKNLKFAFFIFMKYFFLHLIYWIHFKTRKIFFKSGLMDKINGNII